MENAKTFLETLKKSSIKLERVLGFWSWITNEIKIVWGKHNYFWLKLYPEISWLTKWSFLGENIFSKNILNINKRCLPSKVSWAHKVTLQVKRQTKVENSIVIMFVD